MNLFELSFFGYIIVIVAFLSLRAGLMYRIDFEDLSDFEKTWFL